MMRMARAQEQRVASQAPVATAGSETPSDTSSALSKGLESVARFIPTEAVTVYVAGLGLFTPSSQREKWIVFVIGLAVVGALVLLNAPVAAFKSRVAGWRPAAVLIISSVAFVAWAAATPGGPFDDISARATIWGGFAVLVIAPILPLLAKRLGITE